MFYPYLCLHVLSFHTIDVGFCNNAKSWNKTQLEKKMETLKVVIFCFAKRKSKSKETIKNDPRECIRADNILKQNVTRFPRVSAPSYVWGWRAGVRRGGGRRSPPFNRRGVIVDCGVVTPRTF